MSLTDTTDGRTDGHFGLHDDDVEVEVEVENVDGPARAMVVARHFIANDTGWVRYVLVNRRTAGAAGQQHP